MPPFLSWLHQGPSVQRIARPHPNIALPLSLPPSQGPDVQHIARLLLQPQQSHAIDFWLEVDLPNDDHDGGDDNQQHCGAESKHGSAGSTRSTGSGSSCSSTPTGRLPLRVELSISYLDRTEALKQVRGRRQHWGLLPGERQ